MSESIVEQRRHKRNKKYNKRKRPRVKRYDDILDIFEYDIRDYDGYDDDDE